MSFLDDSLKKHLRQVQGPSPEELKLRAEVTTLTEALRQCHGELKGAKEEVAHYKTMIGRPAPPPAIDRSSIFGRLVALSEQKTPYDQTVTISMRVDARLMAPTERHDREMIARELSAYVEQEILRCRLVDPGVPHPKYNADPLKYYPQDPYERLAKWPDKWIPNDK